MQMYIAAFTDRGGKFHIVLLRANSPGDASYCVRKVEAWREIMDLQVAFTDPKKYADHLPIGVIRELSR